MLDVSETNTGQRLWCNMKKMYKNKVFMKNYYLKINNKEAKVFIKKLFEKKSF